MERTPENMCVLYFYVTFIFMHESTKSSCIDNHTAKGKVKQVSSDVDVLHQDLGGARWAESQPV